MIQIPPDYRELKKGERIHGTDIKIEITQTVFDATNAVKSSIGMIYNPDPTRIQYGFEGIIVRLKYTIGSRVTIQNPPLTTQFNNQSGTIVYIRKSRVIPNQRCYFIDLDNPVDGNGCINLRAEFLVPEAPVVKVKLNDKYTAEVSQKGIKVGCQTFPDTIIDALDKARNKVHEI